LETQQTDPVGGAPISFCFNFFHLIARRHFYLSSENELEADMIFFDSPALAPWYTIERARVIRHLGLTLASFQTISFSFVFSQTYLILLNFVENILSSITSNNIIIKVWFMVYLINLALFGASYTF